MSKLMVKCPTTGKLVFTGKEFDPGRLTEIRLTFIGQTTIIQCPYCGEDHDLKKEELSLVPD